jgi:putative solute:sodium symporter small subunit
LTEQPIQQRTVVTHPRTIATRVGARAGPLPDPTGPNALNDLQVRALMRAQLRLGLRYLSMVALLLAVLPIIFATTEVLAATRLFGIPLTWLIIGGGLFPCMIIVALAYNRATDRLESSVLSPQTGSTVR